ncbi:MAG: hypothetical protein QG629_866 [Patescibacteria group bacterium]|nr:hypothetical protein [Patescibacteria group bacterium]
MGCNRKHYRLLLWRQTTRNGDIVQRVRTRSWYTHSAYGHCGDKQDDHYNG